MATSMSCAYKELFTDKDVAHAAARQMATKYQQAMNVYRCTFHNGWHIGNQSNYNGARTKRRNRGRA